MTETKQPHDGAQSQADDEPAPSTDASPPAPENVRPAIAAPGKPDGEVDTRR